MFHVTNATFSKIRCQDLGTCLCYNAAEEMADHLVFR